MIRVLNRGNATMTVTGLSGPGGGAFVASWTQGAVAAGQWQDITVRFTPTEVRSYNGTLTVQADHTSGANTMPIVAAGILPPRPQFTRTGIGNTVFDMPRDVRRLRIIGIYQGNSSNFIIRIAGRLVVNELIGRSWPTGTRYQGDHLVPSECAASAGTTCVVEITNSTGVEWSFEEIGR